MSSRKSSRNPLSTLLDSVFGSEAAVRIVRELCVADAPLSRSEIARRTGFSLPGVSYALNKLHAAGVTEFVGEGSRQSVQMRVRHPLATHLSMLFFVERGYADAVQDRLRRAVASVSPAPRAAWLEPGICPAPSLLTVVVRARDVSPTREQLRCPLADLEADLDIAVEARVLTEADVETADDQTVAAWEQATPVYGRGYAGVAVAPSVELGRRTHQARDAAALHRGVWLSKQLAHDPTLLKRAKEWLVTHIPDVSPHEEHELKEWLDVLHHSSVPRIQHMLSDPGERGKRLRQSNPFIPVLSPREREQMRKEVSL